MIPHTVHKALVERLLRQIFIVFLQVLFRRRAKLHGGELVATLLESRDDIADEPTLDPIGLDGNEPSSHSQLRSQSTQFLWLRGERGVAGKTNVCSVLIVWESF